MNSSASCSWLNLYGFGGGGGSAEEPPASGPGASILPVSSSSLEEVDASRDLCSGVTGLAALPRSDAVLESAVSTSGKSNV